MAARSLRLNDQISARGTTSVTPTGHKCDNGRIIVKIRPISSDAKLFCITACDLNLDRHDAPKRSSFYFSFQSITCGLQVFFFSLVIGLSWISLD